MSDNNDLLQTLLLALQQNNEKNDTTTIPTIESPSVESPTIPNISQISGLLNSDDPNVRLLLNTILAKLQPQCTNTSSVTPMYELRSYRNEYPIMKKQESTKIIKKDEPFYEDTVISASMDEGILNLSINVEMLVIVMIVITALCFMYAMIGGGTRSLLSNPFDL